MLNYLEEEDYNAAISYIEYLAASRRKKRAVESRKVLAEMHNLVKNDTPWANEDEMLAELAAFRRERMGL